MRSVACASMGARCAWDKEPAGVCDGVAECPRYTHRCGIGGRRRGTTRWAADGSRLSNAGGEGSPALSPSAVSVRHGDDGATNRRKGSYGAPLPGAPNVGSGVPAEPLRFKLWGAREVLSLLPIYALAH